MSARAHVTDRQAVLWRQVCEARANSRAYRAADDPIVRAALEAWEATFTECDNTSSGVILPFRTAERQ